MMDKHQFKGVYWVYIILVILGISVVSFISMSNSLVRSENSANNQLSKVQVALQRRYDLIPNLVSSVKGEMNNEQKVYGKIADARKTYNASQDKFNKSSNSADKVQALESAERSLDVSVNAVREAYPNLGSSKQVATLMAQIEGSENRIQTERDRYNDEVTNYNNSISVFPKNIVAGMTGHTDKLPLFQNTVKSNSAPNVKF